MGEVVPKFRILTRTDCCESNPTAAVTGLAVAWGGTALLLGPATRGLDDPSQPAMALVGQALFLALVVAIVASVLFWEKQSLRSLWLQPFRWRSVGWGLVLVAVYYAILLPLGQWVRLIAGLPGFNVGMDQVMKFPLWYRLVAVVGAGIGEEVLFRGFSVTRFAMVTGRLWLGAVIAVVGFYVLHVPVWGWGFVLGGLITGAAATAFFVWRKDLLAMMVFHMSTDAVGLVVAPLFSEWWKKPVLF